MPNNKLSVLSLFSGCGGMDLGFEGGFKVRAESVNKEIHTDWIDKVSDDNKWVWLKKNRFCTKFANDIIDNKKTLWVAYFISKVMMMKKYIVFMTTESEPDDIQDRAEFNSEEEAIQRLEDLSKEYIFQEDWYFDFSLDDKNKSVRDLADKYESQMERIKFGEYWIHDNHYNDGRNFYLMSIEVEKYEAINNRGRILNRIYKTRSKYIYERGRKR